MRKAKFWSRAGPALDLVSGLRDLSEPFPCLSKGTGGPCPPRWGSQSTVSLQGLVGCRELLFAGYWTWSPRLGFMGKPGNPPKWSNALFKAGCAAIVFPRRYMTLNQCHSDLQQSSTVNPKLPFTTTKYVPSILLPQASTINYRRRKAWLPPPADTGWALRRWQVPGLTAGSSGRESRATGLGLASPL